MTAAERITIDSAVCHGKLRSRVALPGGNAARTAGGRDERGADSCRLRGSRTRRHPGRAFIRGAACASESHGTPGCMKFLVDAQLPRRLCAWLRETGHDALHTLDLPEGNRTTDAEILELARHEGRVVVTKDDDFVQSHLVSGPPELLLLVATGNIGNEALETLMRANIAANERALAGGRFVEIGRDVLTVHD